MKVVLQIYRSIPQNRSSLPDTSHKHPDKKRLLQKGKGFTIIEIMVVIVIIGILASIAIGLSFRFREDAFISSMKSDLSNAFKHSIVYFSDYPDGVLTKELLEANGYTASENVNIEVIDGNQDSLRITATHPNVIATYEVDNTGDIFKQ